MLRYRVIASVPAAFYAEREICHVSRGVLFSVEVHFTPLDSHRNWQPLAQQIPRKATYHNNRSEREEQVVPVSGQRRGLSIGDEEYTNRHRPFLGMWTWNVGWSG
jgi:hypothetical protein